MQSAPSVLDPRRRSQRIALGVLMGLTFLVVVWMAAPLLVGLALGTVMAFTAQPLHARLCARLHERRVVASGLATLLGGLLMVGGGVVIFWLLAREFVKAVTYFQAQIAAGPSAFLGPRTTRLLDAVGLHRGVVIARVRDELGRLANVAAQAAGVVVQASAGVLLTVVVSLWTMFYVLVDWPRIARRLERLLPLDPRHTRALVDEFRDVGRRAFVGTLVSAVYQGTLAAIGFALTNVPQPIACGGLLAIFSFIPVAGTLLVWVPAAVWLLTSGHAVRALFLAVWNLVLVMAANDYVIRPRLVGRHGDAHPFLMLVSLLGGISVFGIAGVIVGPVTMSLFVASARIYERERTADLAAEGFAAEASSPETAAHPDTPLPQRSIDRA